MLKYKTYVKILSALLISIFGGAYIYIYIYSINYPIPLFNRISLDAKIMFLRDMTNKKDIDTIIIGSSIGLNNIQGIVLEESSKRVKHVLNLSSFSMEVTHIEQIWELIALFPNVKRVIYSAQSLDFTGESNFEKTDIDFIKGYIDLDPKSINLKYSFSAYKNFIQCIKRQWIWKDKHMTNRKFSNLDFDYTGSAPLHIYGKDILEDRWINSYVAKTNEESYLSLGRIIKKANEDDIIFYLAIQPYRAPLIKQHEHIRDVLRYFHINTEKTALNSGGEFLNLHNKLHLSDDYFADRMHLNDKGSLVTTLEVAKYIDAHEK